MSTPAIPGIPFERGDSERTGEYSDPLDMARSQGYGHWAVDAHDMDASFGPPNSTPSTIVVPVKRLETYKCAISCTRSHRMSYSCAN
jgi:hypothetical protein